MKQKNIICYIIFIDIILYISYVRNLKNYLIFKISLSNIKRIESVYKNGQAKEKMKQLLSRPKIQ